MPIKQDILDAIDKSDLEAAKEAYAVVAGNGLGGHDRQIISRLIKRLEANLEREEQEAAVEMAEEMSVRDEDLTEEEIAELLALLGEASE
jgi:hypothetical protein